MKIKKWIISFMVTIALLIPISRSPSIEVKANTNTSLELRNLVMIMIGGLTSAGFATQQLADNFFTNVSNGVSGAVDIYNQINQTVENWKADNFVSQGTYTNNPIMIPKSLVKSFNKQIASDPYFLQLSGLEISDMVLNQFNNDFFGTWFHTTIYYQQKITDTTLSGKPSKIYQFATYGPNANGDLYYGGFFNTEIPPAFKTGVITVSEYIDSFGTAFWSTYHYINGKQLHSNFKDEIKTLYGSELLPVLITYNKNTNIQTVTPRWYSQEYTNRSRTYYTMQHFDRLLGFSKGSIIDQPDENGNTTLTNNTTTNVVINNYGESINKNDVSIALPTSPDAWSDKNTDTIIPPYTGSLPVLKDGVLTNSDGSVYPLPQFPTPSIDVSWDILATLQNLFSWLASVLKWIVDMSIYGLYMILAQLGLTQYFNIVIEFFKSIFDLLLSGFKFLFRSLSTLPDFFKFLIALLALIFDSILKFINLIITLIIHTFYDLINSALLSYTSITRLLPSPLNSVANATVGLVTSFLTFKVIKNIIGGLRS